MRSDEKLGGIEDVLPNDVRCRAEGGEGVEIGLRHPDTEGGVLLTESLPGCDGRNAFHGFGGRGRVDEDILVVPAFAGSGQFVADIFAETELEKADEERTY